MITGKLLEKEGLHKSEGLSSQELKNLPPIQKVQMAESLSALSGDFVFFNHGLLFTEAGFTADPVEEFMLKLDDYQAVFAVEYERPLFKGLNFVGDGSWNKILLGCKVEVWPDLYRLLNTLIAVGNKGVYSCFMQNAYMPDPNLWTGVMSGVEVSSAKWGETCERADRGLSGDSRYKDVAFPSYPSFIKIHLSGVSGPSRLAYFKSGLWPCVNYDKAESATLKLQAILEHPNEG
jgi:hypothetical protein